MKKVTLIISSIVLCVALALTVLAGVLLPCTIAYAASEKDVILATVSNLEGNEYPVASTIVLKNQDGEFAIPESYYVTNMSKAFGNTFSVNYCGQSFYLTLDDANIPTSKVTFDDGVLPYPDITLTIVGESLVLNGNTITNDYTIKFLGYHLTDGAQIFVMATYDGNTVYGFAQKDAFNAFVVPYHPIAQAERERIISSKLPPEPKSGDIVPNTSLALRIVLIIGIALPAVIIVVLLFKPSKNDVSGGKNQLRRARKKDEFDYDSSRSYSPDRAYDDHGAYRGDYQNGGYQNGGNYQNGGDYDNRQGDYNRQNNYRGDGYDNNRR